MIIHTAMVDMVHVENTRDVEETPLVVQHTLSLRNHAILVFNEGETPLVDNTLLIVLNSIRFITRKVAHPNRHRPHRVAHRHEEHSLFGLPIAPDSPFEHDHLSLVLHKRYLRRPLHLPLRKVSTERQSLPEVRSLPIKAIVLPLSFILLLASEEAPPLSRATPVLETAFIHQQTPAEESSVSVGNDGRRTERTGPSLRFLPQVATIHQLWRKVLFASRCDDRVLPPLVRIVQPPSDADAVVANAVVRLGVVRDAGGGSAGDERVREARHVEDDLHGMTVVVDEVVEAGNGVVALVELAGDLSLEEERGGLHGLASDFSEGRVDVHTDGAVVFRGTAVDSLQLAVLVVAAPGEGKELAATVDGEVAEGVEDEGQRFLVLRNLVEDAVSLELVLAVELRLHDPAVVEDEERVLRTVVGLSVDGLVLLLLRDAVVVEVRAELVGF